jgi:hypothetical protein
MRPAHAVVLTTSLLLTACSGMTMRVKPAGTIEQRIQHVVLVELDDPSRASEMMQDMREAFEAIPVLAGWQAGPKVDTGRPQVQAWYTVGIVTEFDTVEDYRAYLEHPRHKALVEKWKPRWKRSEMFDFGSVGATAGGN